MSSSRVVSEYYQQLTETARKRYDEKLDMIGVLCDPYAKKNPAPWSTESTTWPEVEYPDVYNYLVSTPSPYTKQEMKAYKSLEGYKYFVDGWVAKVLVQHGTTTSGSDFAVVIARVRHSQKLSDTPVKPWIAALQNGTVLCAHCTCMAGLGEACSHVAALLFTMEANTRYRNSVSCTSQLCAWLPPTLGKTIEYSPAADIDFTTPETKRRHMSDGYATSTTIGTRSSKKIPANEPIDAELENLYTELSPGKPVMLSHVPGHSQEYIPASATTSLPLPLTEVFQEDMLESSYPELLEVCTTVFDGITITTEQAKRLHEETQKQSESKLWFRHRAGRVTASRFKAAAHTNPDNPSQSLIKEICYPTSRKAFSEAITWGLKNEPVARAMYNTVMKEKHSHLSVTLSGLVVHPDYPHLGASPDGIVKCKCCTGTGVLEIKCPFRCKTLSFLEASNSKDFCLQLSKDGGLELDTQHAYYYQVQAQIILTGAKYCDFVVWSPEEFVTLRISPDAECLN